jgi:hypothetical protein
MINNELIALEPVLRVKRPKLHELSSVRPLLKPRLPVKRECSSVPELQAEPVPNITSINFKSKASASTSGNVRLLVFGIRLVFFTIMTSPGFAILMIPQIHLSSQNSIIFNA